MSQASVFSTLIDRLILNVETYLALVQKERDIYENPLRNPNAQLEKVLHFQRVGIRLDNEILADGNDLAGRLAEIGEDPSPALVLVHQVTSVLRDPARLEAAWPDLSVKLRTLACQLRARDASPAQTSLEDATRLPRQTKVTTRDQSPLADHEIVDQQTQLNMALALLLVEGPNVTRIADKIGVPRTTLNGWPTFTSAVKREREKIAAQRESMRRRLKTANVDDDHDED